MLLPFWKVRPFPGELSDPRWAPASGEPVPADRVASSLARNGRVAGEEGRPEPALALPSLLDRTLSVSPTSHSRRHPERGARGARAQELSSRAHPHPPAARFTTTPLVTQTCHKSGGAMAGLLPGCQAPQTCVQVQPRLWLGRPEMTLQTIQLFFRLDLSLPFGHAMAPGKEKGQLTGACALGLCWRTVGCGSWVAREVGGVGVEWLGEGMLALWPACSGFPCFQMHFFLNPFRI